MSDDHTLRIEGEFTIFRAMELKPVLFAEPPVTDIDLSAVTELDSAGLQLLMLAKREAGRMNKQLSIVKHSQVVRQTIDFCNLAAFFGDATATGNQAQRDFGPRPRAAVDRSQRSRH